MSISNATVSAPDSFQTVVGMIPRFSRIPGQAIPHTRAAKAMSPTGAGDAMEHRRE